MGTAQAPSGGNASPSKEAKSAERASGTNNQVAGVDEADIVKTDGKYVYLASNGALRIVEALNPKMVSVTKVSGTAKELFVEGDRAVVYTSTGGNGNHCTYAYDCTVAGDGSSTTVTVLDIKDRTAPKTVRTFELTGSLMAARRVGTAIHTVVADNDNAGQYAYYPTWPSTLAWNSPDNAAARDSFAKLKVDNERAIRQKTTTFATLRENGVEKRLCDNMLRTTAQDGHTLTSIVSFDLRDDHAKPSTASVQSRPGIVFASADALYFSVVRSANGQGASYPSYGSDEVSEIHKIRIGKEPSDTRYVGSGVVPGHVLNQFAMDEWQGDLRVATTKGRVPDPKVESVVSVLRQDDNGNLVRVGAIDKIAPGEDIRAVRFDNEQAYVVTFKKTDPLFVLDLEKPSAPKILGELKIPGFSTYIHRLDATHLLSIGFDANDHGDFAYFDGVILQMFDVTNLQDPKLLHKEKIGTRGSSSQAATDHLAFNFMPTARGGGLLAIPMTICEGGGDGRNGDKLAFSGLLIYDVKTQSGFKRLGGIDHGTQGVSCGTWWSNANSTVQRSVFLDDLVYSIATDRLKVQRLAHLGKDVADLSLM